MWGPFPSIVPSAETTGSRHRLRVGRVAVGPFAKPGEVVVVAGEGDALGAQAGGEAGAGLEVGGEQAGEAVQGLGGERGVEGEDLAGAEADQLEMRGRAGGQAVEAAGGGDGGFEGSWRWKARASFSEGTPPDL
jgi:hypothetical protein